MLKAGVLGAVSGAAFGAIGAASGGWNVGQKMLAHGMTGGITNVLQGGKFGHGFVSAGFTKFASVKLISNFDGNGFGAIMGRTAMASMTGGTVSELTGGKFANGAKTAALAHLVNQESKAILEGPQEERQAKLDERLKAFKKQFLSGDDVSWDMELRAKALSVVYDPDYGGVAVIDSKPGSETFGRITVGPDFFDAGRISLEVTSQVDVDYINGLSDADYASFVLRHELAHIAPYQIEMLKPYRQGLKNIPLNRSDQVWEQRATQDALDWMRAR